MSDPRYLDIYNDAVKALKSHQIMINVADIIVKQMHGDVSQKSSDEIKQLREQAQNSFLAYGYIRGMDKDHYGKIKEDLHNDFVKGQNNYPNNITEAYEMQTIFWTHSKNRNTNKNSNSNNKTGISFYNKKRF